MSLAEGNAVVSAAGAHGLALRSNVVGADEDDAQSIVAQATTVGAAGMQGITLQNTVLRVGGAEIARCKVSRLRDAKYRATGRWGERGGDR
jgi:hypothetical protein